MFQMGALPNNGDIPTVLGSSPDPGSVFVDPSGHASGPHGITILNPSNTGHHHTSLRDSMVGSNGGSATQIHTIRSSQPNSGTGPIRNKHRKDTSPYGSDRLSISNASAVGSSSHLSPPDTWRRVRSDPFLHSSVTSTSSTGVSPAGSVTDTPTAVQGSNGAISPLHGASPTMQRRGTYDCFLSYELISIKIYYNRPLQQWIPNTHSSCN